jgi:uncharacterized protein involved in exopolysaccharide biosynthesis
VAQARQPDDPANAALGLIDFLLRRKWAVGGSVAAGLITGTLLAILMRPIYRAEVKVIAVDQSGTSSTMMDVAGALGGLAGVAGLLDLKGAETRNVSLEMLRSRSLAQQFIQDFKIVDELDPDADDGGSAEEVLNRSVRRFDRKIRDVEEDRRTGIVTLAVEWFDGKKAADWANGLVAMSNQKMRYRAVTDARRNIKYLDAALNNATSVEIRQALYRLMEGELKARMLAEVREEYALKVIDPAVPPDPKEFVRPKRWLLILGGAVGGFLIGWLLAAILDLFAEFRTKSAA